MIHLATQYQSKRRSEGRLSEEGNLTIMWWLSRMKIKLILLGIPGINKNCQKKRTNIRLSMKWKWSNRLQMMSKTITNWPQPKFSRWSQMVNWSQREIKKILKSESKTY
jgi:hypothetical protein